MDVTELQQRLLDQYGIRVEPQMGQYVLVQFQQAGGALRELPVIGGDARTGMPLRRTIDVSALQSPPAQTL